MNYGQEPYTWTMKKKYWQKLWTRTIYMNYEQKIFTKTMDKNHIHKLWTKDIDKKTMNKNYEQELWTWSIWTKTTIALSPSLCSISDSRKGNVYLHNSLFFLFLHLCRMILWYLTMNLVRSNCKRWAYERFTLSGWDEETKFLFCSE